MPAIITHIIIAEEIINSISIELDRDAFFWGTLGPDVFYYNIFNKEVCCLGKKLHLKNATDILSEMCRDVIEENDKNSKKCKLSYILGFACHVAADSILHPYIYEKAAEFSKRDFYSAKYMHHKIEHAIDAQLLKEKNKSYNEINLLLKKDEFEPILQLYVRVIFTLLNMTYKKKKLRGLFINAKKTMKLFSDQKGTKRKFLVMIEKAFKFPVKLSAFVRLPSPSVDFDYMNYNLSNKNQSVYTVYDLLNAAEQFAIELCSTIEQSVISEVDPVFQENISFGVK